MQVHKLKCSEKELREYLLDKYVDKMGYKVSDRRMMGDEVLMELTGWFRIDELTGKKLPSSPGTISYWKRKLGLLEYEVFIYHRDVTGRIKQDCDFLLWCNKLFKGKVKAPEREIKRKGKNSVAVYNQKTEQKLIMDVCGFPNHFENYTPQRVRDLACELWIEMGLDPKEELERIQENVYEFEKRNKLKKEQKVHSKVEQNMSQQAKKYFKEKAKEKEASKNKSKAKKKGGGK